MTGIVLAGGRASRMKGVDKAFLKVRGKPIIIRQITVLKKIFKDIIIVTNDKRKYKNLKGVKLVSDIIRGKGPLAGIHAGLVNSKTFHNFVVACDMPFLNKALIKFFIGIRNSYDCIVPKIKNRIHPLFGIYSKGCIPVIEEMLAKSKLNISSIFEDVKKRLVIAKEVKRFDPRLYSLTNINTKEDFKAASRILSKCLKN